MTLAVEGTCDPAFEAVRDAFASNFENGLETGASLAIGVNGRQVVDIWAGHTDEAQTRPWERDTIACIFSSTKGVVAVLAHMLADRGLLDLDAPVATYWPEFAKGGKASHQGAPRAGATRRTP